MSKCPKIIIRKRLLVRCHIYEIPLAHPPWEGASAGWQRRPALGRSGLGLSMSPTGPENWDDDDDGGGGGGISVRSSVGREHGNVSKTWNSLPGNCYFHLQLLIFCLNGFIRVDPRNDCLQPLLLLPLPHVTIHVPDKCLHIPVDVLYQNWFWDDNQPPST